MKTNITVHCVCKNEPFIYYSIKSVYDFCDKILLYDTGSTDAHTLEDIGDLLEEDIEKKISFRQVPLDFDEEKWSLDGLEQFIKEHHGKMSVGRVRQMQIDVTKTKYFMMVDGDEVHYHAGMVKIIKDLMPNLPENKYEVGLPLLWFYDLNTIFNKSPVTFPYNGRIVKTDMVYMNGDSPNEQHVIRGINEIFTYEHPNYLVYNEGIPYAHFETVLRPWRRKNKVKINEIEVFLGDYPRVMKQNPYYLERYLNEQKV